MDVVLNVICLFTVLNVHVHYLLLAVGLWNTYLHHVIGMSRTTSVVLLLLVNKWGYDSSCETISHVLLLLLSLLPSYLTDKMISIYKRTVVDLG